MEDEEVGVLMDNEFDSDSNNTIHNCILSRLKLLGIVGSESHLEHVSQGCFKDRVRRKNVVRLSAADKKNVCTPSGRAKSVRASTAVNVIGIGL